MNVCVLLISVPTLLPACSPQFSSRDRLVFYDWGDAAEIASYEKIASDFEKETGIHVEVQPATDDYYDNLNVSSGIK